MLVGILLGQSSRVQTDVGAQGGILVHQLVGERVLLHFGVLLPETVVLLCDDVEIQEAVDFKELKPVLASEGGGAVFRQVAHAAELLETDQLLNVEIIHGRGLAAL